MPNIKSAKKRVKINDRKTLENKRVKKIYKEAVKSFELAILNNEKNATELFTIAVSSIDKAVSKGVIKKITASRKIANLSKKVTK